MLKSAALFSSFGDDSSTENLEQTVIERSEKKADQLSNHHKLVVNESLSSGESDQSSNSLVDISNHIYNHSKQQQSQQQQSVKKQHPSIAKLKKQSGIAAGVTIISDSPNQGSEQSPNGNNNNQSDMSGLLEADSFSSASSFIISQAPPFYTAPAAPSTAAALIVETSDDDIEDDDVKEEEEKNNSNAADNDDDVEYVEEKQQHQLQQKKKHEESSDAVPAGFRSKAKLNLSSTESNTSCDSKPASSNASIIQDDEEEEKENQTADLSSGLVSSPAGNQDDSPIVTTRAKSTTKYNKIDDSSLLSVEENNDNTNDDNDEPIESVPAKTQSKPIQIDDSLNEPPEPEVSVVSAPVAPPVAAVKKIEDDFIVLSDTESPVRPKLKRSEDIKQYFAAVKESPPAQASPSVASRKFNDQKPVASWSPNYEKVKSKIQQSMKQNSQQMRTMKMVDDFKSLQQNQTQAAPNADEEIDLAKFKSMQFQANVIRGPNEQVTNKHYSYEYQLKELSKQIINVIEEKPNPDDIPHDEEEHNAEINSLKPRGLKVNLLNHQIYSMKWLKWREATYPYGGILADDMGLGKTLTILSYLKLIKEKRARMLNKKKNSNTEDKDEEEEEQEEDDEEEDKKKKRRDYNDNEDDGDDDEDYEDELNGKNYLLKRKHKLKSKQQQQSTKQLSGVKPLKTLIILPASLLHQWEGEIKNRFEENTFKYHIYHGDNRKRLSFNLNENDIVFTTYEIVSREVIIVDKQGNEFSSSDSPLARIKWKRIILDEAHRIKNHTTKANKSICSLRAKYRIAITGTPIHNSLTDFYSLVKFLHFTPLDDYSLWQYIFASEKFNNRNMPKANAVERENRMSNWLGLLSSYLILRRTKADKIKGTEKKIVDLPDKNIETISLKLNEYEKKIYETIFDESKKKVNEFLQQRLVGKTGGSGNFLSEILVYLLRLRQACCHMSLLSECIDRNALQNIKLETDGIEGLMQNLTLDSSTASMDSNINDPAIESIKKLKTSSSDFNLDKCFNKTWRSSKIEKLMEMIQEILDNNLTDKIIVVSQWTSMLRIVAKFLSDEELDFCEINGQIPLIKRNEIVENFNKKSSQRACGARIMLLSLTAGGIGLNLVGANHMFLLDIHWNPALEQQAADRIYRVGQKKSVFVYRFICENSIEERIREIQEHKLEIARKVCDASSASGGSVAGTAKLTLSDFKLLFKDFDNKDQQ